ncbi:TPA: RusA family crossover junction endodeoxyribonuclease [Vibrio parahaemolyticus]|uniref:RusA family crossover junction endodeoxyribonuclease n=2 Tax=Vibrio parahaemolyticus TaxID=670 RepID=A0AA47JLT1_VIBPH|nr:MULTISPECIES: RusA family crossover junction endodeoxyribonuclease [Vibrio]MDW2293157.1 RusA family crossover junction endodeoxyribonuclease [Vibrio sp. 1404]HDY7614465.1 RusA family crossover junction endodeoxyribonuclease [Vibrio vulnificus]EGR1951263.1 RusA family crossover junction endodeoxyribonuclease [Vibrio parahaemolyticus]EGR3328512.1 RusA family crossover junction endodeoxyribonuclease [Vibrio parahaemolyticus]EGR9044554.1 RusA family crossover junction endodeoxyribonuclease [Vib
MSTNDMYQGVKVKSAAYRRWEMQVARGLPDLELPKDKRLAVRAIVRYSNKASDLDNCCKSMLDVLQKRYKFDDKNVYVLKLYKVIVPKGQEGLTLKITELEETKWQKFVNEKLLPILQSFLPKLAVKF